MDKINENHTKNYPEFELSREDMLLLSVIREERKRKKLKIFLLLFCLTLFVSGMGIYLMMNPKERLFLQTNEIILELGEKVSVSADTYLDQDSTNQEAYKLAKISSNLILDSINYELLSDNTVISRGKNYLDAGTYTLKISYLSETKTVKIVVQDTISPVFEVFTKNITVEYGEEIKDWSEYYQATDLTNVMISVNDSKVDYSIAGDYEITVTATDGSGNTNTKTATVTVNEKPEPTPTPIPATSNSSSSSSSSSSNSRNNSSSNSSSSNSSSSNSSSSSSNSSSSSSNSSSSSSSTTSHGLKYFMFSDGYDLDSGYSACMAALYSIGYGSCTPIMSDGIYTGYKLEY